MARIQVYVDDPQTALIGTKPLRDNILFFLTMAWEVLGIPLASKKGQGGQDADVDRRPTGGQTRQGGSICPCHETADTLDQASGLVRASVAPRKGLRSFVGKISSSTSLTALLLPFEL